MNFYDSNNDVLVLFGPDNCAKNVIVEHSLEFLSDNFLTFYHNCFAFSTIDDFLLNFYDSFKKHSVSKSLVFRKAVSEHFSSKIINYFKESVYDFLIIIDNFELVAKKKEILDFLFHIASFEHVKLLLNTSVPYEVPDKLKSLKIEIPYEDIAASDEEARANKIVSIIPPNYRNAMENLAMLQHCSNREFLGEYNLIHHAEIAYLLKISALEETEQGLYLKKYLKNLLLRELNLKEKAEQAVTLIEIYEQELAKSPKDRLLRLSRESIRALIGYFSTMLQKTGPKISQNFTYMAQVRSGMLEWNKFQEEKPKEETPEKKPQEMSVLEYLEAAEEYEEVYNYTGAIELLNRARFLNKDEALDVKIFLKLAKNYLKTNNFESAINFEIKLFDIYKKNDEPRALHTLYKIGLIYKNLFDYTKTIEYFEKVLAKPDVATAMTMAKTLISYGEINEQENKIEDALKKYECALEILEKEERGVTLLCEVYYKIAQIYDIEREIELARSFYEKNIELSQDYRINSCLGASYLGLADTLETSEALDYYKFAADVFEKGKNFEDLYFIYNKLAQSFKYSNPKVHIGYLMDAKEVAEKSKDDFKLAFVLCEIGDYYYNQNFNENALFSYLKAKEILGENSSEENIAKINLRLSDMKVKMGAMAFEAALRDFRDE